MWLDVEEEQEFAWLMSDVSNTPPPLPPSSPMGIPGETVHIERLEDLWGMDNFTSVLTLSKAKPVKNKDKKGKHAIGESFMNFGEEVKKGNVPRRVPRLEISEPVHPWASQSNPLPLPQVSSPPCPISSDTESTGMSPPRSDSPHRVKNRPPPLTLKDRIQNPNLPVISTTPSTGRTPAPITPFTKPRRAPIPGYQPDLIPAMPVLPHYEEEISYFEPVTPTEEKPVHRRVLSGGAAAAANKSVRNGGAWLKKVVNGVKI